jgi:hypothetical protein
MKRIALACVLCLLAGTVNATFEVEDPDGKIYDELMGEQEEKEVPPAKTTEPLQDWEGKGAGHMSCAQYLSSMQQASTSYSLGLSWLQGYVSGAGHRPENSGQDLERDLVSIAIWTEEYCKKNQADKLSEAAEKLVEESK